ncbi:lipopolysaccharide biosynthesis protein [Microbacterium sp. 1P10UB]|uniref:lipopolysaccharide biosynthesis protein n=1 Tax=unclassified Microbacterium TaxID=2609290 RepID=UPI00399F4581
MTDDSEFRRRAVSGAGWVAADKWSNRIMGLLVLVVLGRLLSPQDFGLVAVATAFMAFAAVFVEQGLGRSLVQKDDLSSIYPNTTLWASLATSGVVAAVIIALAPLIASVYGAGDELTPVIQWLAVGLVINALSSTPAALLEREFKFKSLAIRRFAGTMAGGVAAVVAALLGLGVWSLVIQSLTTGIVGLATLWTASTWRPEFEFSFSKLKELWGTGTSIIGMELIGLLNSQADRLLIGAFLGPTTLGYYFMAIRIVSIIVELFSSVFSGISLTTFSRLQNDRPRLLAWFYKLTSMSSTTAIPIFAVAGTTAPVVLPFVFGAQWAPSVILMQILCFLGALNAVAYFDRSVLIAVGKARAALLLTLGQAILGLVLVVIALPWGVVFVAIAVTLRQYAYWPMRLAILKRNVGVEPWRYFLQWLRPFGLSVLAVGLSLLMALYLPQLSQNAPIVFVAANVLIVAIIFLAGIWVLNRSFFSDLMKIVRRKM